MTIQELAKRWKYHPYYLKKIIKEGKINLEYEIHPTNGAWIFDGRKVDAFERKNRFLGRSLVEKTKNQNILSISDLAKRWGLSIDAIYKRMLHGAPMPPKIECERKTVFHLSEVIKFENEQQKRSKK